MDVVEHPPAASSADLAGLAPDVAAALSVLAQVTDTLCAADVSQCEGRAALAMVNALAAATSRLEALKIRTLPVVEADGLWATGGARSFATWVARRHHLPTHTAHAQVRLGRTLRDSLPLTDLAARSGEISLAHAQVLATLAPTTPQRCAVLADPDNECNEAFLVGEARTRSVDGLRLLTRHSAAVFDPDADDRGYVEACDREHLQLSRLGDGYHLQGWLTVPHGQTLKVALEAATAVPAADDDRTTDQRRAQALADVAQISLDHGRTGSRRTTRPRLSVLVGHAELAALVAAARRRSGEHATGETPARTPGYGTRAILAGESVAGPPQLEDGTPIPRALLDRLACDSEIQRIIFGPVAGHGRRPGGTDLHRPPTCGDRRPGQALPISDLRCAAGPGGRAPRAALGTGPREHERRQRDPALLVPPRPRPSTPHRDPPTTRALGVHRRARRRDRRGARRAGVKA
ncbi:DUF222 domain-containing protein [Cellulomonas aerilata]|uniref:DUF222 domain-containing protein n=1 Tax=Cellulomonas aerilata TaxID=515326 RepID=UPI001649FD50|nr:DUF222 domain-containing protein [Cellulomonas aerilata]